MKMKFIRPFINVHKYRHETNMSYAKESTNVYDIYYSNEKNNKNILVIDIHGGFFKYGKKVDNVPFYDNFLDNGIDVLSVEYTKNDIFLQIFEINKALQFFKENSILFSHEYKSVYLMAEDSSTSLALLQEINKNFKLDLPYKDYKIDGIILINPIYSYKEYLHKLKIIENFKKLFIDSNSYDLLLDKYDYLKYLGFLNTNVLILSSNNDIIKEDSGELYLKLLENNKKVYYYRQDYEFKKSHNINILKPNLSESKQMNQKIIDFILNEGELND